MTQALFNVMDNAARYSPPDSGIVISARRVDQTVEISVTDSGPGIAAKDIERVFDKFYRVRRADGAGGTGLGLAICKGIVEAHGGRIMARNRTGGGTAISIRLPLQA
jgi:two-component system sensor histidine kinase KdpD